LGVAALGRWPDWTRLGLHAQGRPATPGRRGHPDLQVPDLFQDVTADSKRLRSGANRSTGFATKRGVPVVGCLVTANSATGDSRKVGNLGSVSVWEPRAPELGVLATTGQAIVGGGCVAGPGCNEKGPNTQRTYVRSRRKWIAGLLMGGRNAIHPAGERPPDSDTTATLATLTRSLCPDARFPRKAALFRTPPRCHISIRTVAGWRFRTGSALPEPSRAAPKE
jgi:hypothetical protein